MTQGQEIRNAIEQHLNAGITLKKEIYNKVVAMGYPRPTVRRVAREMAIEYQKKADILKPLFQEDELDK